MLSPSPAPAPAASRAEEAARAVWDWTGARARAEEVVRRGKARARALALGGVGLAVAGGLWLWGRTLAAPVVGALAAAGLLAAALSPGRALPALERGAAALGGFLSRAIVTVLLVALFVLFVVPFGLIARRAAGKDPLDRRLDRAAKSYWRPAQPRTGWERQY